MQTDGDKQAEEQIRQTRLKLERKKMETSGFNISRDAAERADSKLTRVISNRNKSTKTTSLRSD